MPIRRHGRGWEVRLQHAGRRISRTVATRQDAQYLEARLRQRINDSRASRIPSYSLEEAFAHWLAGEARLLRSQKTVASLLRMLYPFMRGRSLHEVVEVSEAVKSAGIKSGLAPAPINRRLATLKRVAKLAYRRWGWLENDLGAKIELLPGEKKRSEWVTPAEAKRLISAAKGPVREAIRWAVLTGMRRGEILGLQPRHFKAGVIYLTDTKSGLPRTIPLPSELDPAMFPFGIHPTALSKGFQIARQRAGMPHIRFHDLRRSYGTWLVHSGTDASVVRDLLGHSTIAMTSRYLGSSVPRLQQAVRTLPRLAAGQKRGKKAVSHSRG